MQHVIFPAIRETVTTDLKSSTSKKTSRSVSNRKTRFDKTTTMKFPVTDYEQARFRNLWLIYKLQWQDLWREDDKKKGDLSITMFLTMLLRFGMRHPELMQRQIHYKNTKIHKTVKPNQYEKELISGINGLTVEWQLTSDRKALHLIMLSTLHYLTHGGTLQYEEVQPIKPY